MEGGSTGGRGGGRGKRRQNRTRMPDVLISVIKLMARFQVLSFPPIGSYFAMSFLRAVFQLRIFLGLWIYSWEI